MPESNNREAAGAGIYVTESQLAGALEFFYLDVLAGDHGRVRGEVADADETARALHATLRRMAELRGDEPSRWPATRSELEARLSVALRRTLIVAWRGDVEDGSRAFISVTAHDPAALATVLADDIARQCTGAAPAEAPLPEPDAAPPRWQMNMHAQLARALARTGIVFRWTDLPKFADREGEFTVKAAHPGKLAGQLLRAMTEQDDEPTRPPRLAHADDDDELLIMQGILEHLDALRAIGGGDAVSRALAYFTDRHARRPHPRDGEAYS